jgi:hypothetical protein
VWYAQKLEKVYNIMKIHAMTPFAERNRLQEQKLWGIFPGQRGPKTIFWKGTAKAAA